MTLIDDCFDVFRVFDGDYLSCTMQVMSVSFFDFFFQADWSQSRYLVVQSQTTRGGRQLKFYIRHP